MMTSFPRHFISFFPNEVIMSSNSFFRNYAHQLFFHADFNGIIFIFNFCYDGLIFKLVVRSPSKLIKVITLNDFHTTLIPIRPLP